MVKTMIIDQDYYDEQYFNGGKDAYCSYEYQNSYYEFAKKIIDFCSDSKTFFDVGCGRGFLLRGYIENGINKDSVFGIDWSKWAANNADYTVKDRVKNCGILEFKTNNKYDVVTCFDVLEHIDISQLTDVIDRLKKWCNEYLVVTCMVERVDTDKDKSHISIMTLEDWSNLLKCDYFNVIEVNNKILNENHNKLLVLKRKLFV